MGQAHVETQNLAPLLTVSDGERNVSQRQGESGACGERQLIGHRDGGEEEQNAQSHRSRPRIRLRALSDNSEDYGADREPAEKITRRDAVISACVNPAP